MCRRAHLEADLQGFALERRRHRQHDVGQRGGRRHEEIGVDVEVERRQRGAAAARIRVGEEQVGPEADQASHRVRLLLDDGAIHLARRDVLPTPGAERPVGQAKRPGALLRRDQLFAGDVGRRHGWKLDVAALDVEGSGQGVEQRDRAGHLGGVALLLDAAPRVVGDGPRFPEHPGRVLDVVGRDATDLLDRVGGVAPTDLGGEIEGRATGDPGFARADRVFAEERRLAALALIAKKRGIVDDGRPRRFVPGEISARASRGRDVALGEQPSVVRANQERAVRPLADEGAIVPATLDHDVGDAERQRAVGAGPHAQPEVSLGGEPGAARIDDDEASAAAERRRCRGRVRQSRDARVVAPEQDAAGLLEIGHGRARRAHAHAVGVARRITAAPAAQLQRSAVVRAAERSPQPLDPGRRVRDGRGGWRDHAEHDALGAMLVGQFPQPCGREIQSFVPADLLPARIGVALGPRPLQRVEQPFRMVDELRCRAALGAEGLAGGVRRVRLQRDEAAVLDDGDRAAPGDTERAISLNPRGARPGAHAIGSRTRYLSGQKCSSSSYTRSDAYGSKRSRKNISS